MTDTVKSKFSQNGDILLECGPGWYDLVQHAVKLIDDHVEHIAKRDSNQLLLDEFRYDQIKEKFGGLRIYTTYEDEFIRGVINMAESLSYAICETTGASGTLCIRGSWLKTLCLEEAARQGYKPYSREDRFV